MRYFHVAFCAQHRRLWTDCKAGTLGNRHRPTHSTNVLTKRVIQGQQQSEPNLTASWDADQWRTQWRTSSYVMRRT